VSKVDAHAHVFAEATREDREPDELAPAERSAGVEDLWAHAQAAGVDGVVLVPLGPDASTCARALARWPGRCAGVIVATVADHGADAAQRLRARRAEHRFEGVRMGWLGEPGRPLTDSPAWPLLEAMAADGLVLWSYLPPDQVAHLPELARRLPTLRVVLNHLGFAPIDMTVDEHRRPRFPGALEAATVERVARLADHPSMHLMVSGHYALSRQGAPYDDLRAPVRHLVGAFGAERCLWGSDFPWPEVVPGYRETLDLAVDQLADLPDHEQDLIFGGTARRLFPVLEEESH